MNNHELRFPLESLSPSPLSINRFSLFLRFEIHTKFPNICYLCRCSCCHSPAEEKSIEFVVICCIQCYSSVKRWGIGSIIDSHISKSRICVHITIFISIRTGLYPRLYSVCPGYRITNNLHSECIFFIISRRIICISKPC